MTAAYLPSILVPLIGLVFPGLVMAFAFIYIEQDEVGYCSNKPKGNSTSTSHLQLPPNW